MLLKDYYNILQIESSATQAEIKKAYRKLAHQFHPDKNQQDPYASAQFAEIKEAYEVLSNPAKKEYYLQQRWYQQSTGKRKTQSIITPVTVLKQLLELDKFVFTLDVHRMDKQGLADYISHLLSADHIAQLIPFDEPHVNNQIITVALRTLEPLSYKQSLSIADRLLQLTGEDAGCKKNIAEFLTGKKYREKAEKYRPFILILVVIVICVLIWLMGR